MCKIRCINHNIIYAELHYTSLKYDICVVTGCADALMTLLRLVKAQSLYTVNTDCESTNIKQAEAMQG